jgi:predicted dinucleotide-binding enzyme
MRIGMVGVGMIGSTVAKLWVDAGHEVARNSFCSYKGMSCGGAMAGLNVA